MGEQTIRPRKPVLAALVSLSLLSSQQALAALDTFSTDTLDAKLYATAQEQVEVNSAGYLRVIQEGINTDSASQQVRNRVLLRPPAGLVMQLSSDVKIDELVEAGQGREAYIEIAGVMYTTHTSTAGSMGDVAVSLRLGDRGNGPEAWATILTSLDDTFQNHETDDFSIATGLSNNTTYRLSIAWDGSNGFTFTAGDAQVTRSGPAKVLDDQDIIRVGSALELAGIEQTNATAATRISARIDNVVAIDDRTDIVDFSENFESGTLDNAKWRTGEQRIWVEGGALNFAVRTRSGSAPDNASTVYLRNTSTQSIQADVNLLSSSSIGAEERGGIELGGVFYNDTQVGTAENAVGDISAVLTFEQKDNQLKASYEVRRATNALGTESEGLTSGNFTGSYSQDQFYRAVVTRNDGQLVFVVGEESFTYAIPTTNINDTANASRFVAARARSGSASVNAQVDNLGVDTPTNLPNTSTPTQPNTNNPTTPNNNSGGGGGGGAFGALATLLLALVALLRRRHTAKA